MIIGSLSNVNSITVGSPYLSFGAKLFGWIISDLKLIFYKNQIDYIFISIKIRQIQLQ